MILQATKKAQDFIGIKTADIPDASDAFWCWHVNLFFINRKKCLLVTHTKSLYSVFLYGVVKKELPSLAQRIGASLKEQMRRDDFTIAQISYLLENLGEVAYAKTTDRSTLGTMNDMMHAIKIHVTYDDTTDEQFLSAKINQTPYSRHEFAYLKDEFRHQIESQIRGEV